MKPVYVIVFVVAVMVALMVGGIAGFLLGVASTSAGKEFIKDAFAQEQKADVSHPKEIVRKTFQLKYPANWRIDAADKDYDPDTAFSVKSPGSTFVMFHLGSGQLTPADTLKLQIAPFKKCMGTPSIRYFERYGKFAGKGAVVRGRMLGVPATIKLFALSENGTTVMITQNCPDDDANDVQDGLLLIENSFSLKGRGEAGK